MLTQYVTFDKKEFEHTLARISDRMYYLASNIRYLENLGNGIGVAYKIDTKWWQDTISSTAYQMKNEFKNLEELLRLFGSGIKFDCEKAHKEKQEKERKVLFEKQI